MNGRDIGIQRDSLPHASTVMRSIWRVKMRNVAVEGRKLFACPQLGHYVAGTWRMLSPVGNGNSQDDRASPSTAGPEAAPKSETPDRSGLGFLNPIVARSVLLTVLTLEFAVMIAAGLTMRWEHWRPGIVVPPGVFGAVFTTHGVLGVFGVMAPLAGGAIVSVVFPRETLLPRLNAAALYVCTFAALALVPALAASGTRPIPSVLCAIGLVAVAATVSTVDLGAAFVARRRERASPEYPHFEAGVLASSTALAVVLAAMTINWLRVAHSAAPSGALAFLSWGGRGHAYGRFWFGIVAAAGAGLASDLSLKRPDGSVDASGWRMIAVVALVGLPLFSSGALVAVAQWIVSIALAAGLLRGRAARTSRLAIASVYAGGFAITLVVAATQRTFLALLAPDIRLHDTVAEVARFHYESACGLLAFALAIHMHSRRATSDAYPRRLGRIGAVTTIVGIHVSFFGEFLLGTRGMPRRYHDYLPMMQTHQRVAAVGAAMFAIGVLLAAAALVRGRR